MGAREPVTIVLVAGLPGSGKSFFAERLAAMLGYYYINSDRIRGSLHASGKYSLAEKIAVYKEMLALTERTIAQNQSVVVDATFYHHSMREMFVQLANDHGLLLRMIELTADEEVARQRLRSPRKYSEADFNVYVKIRNEFEEITMPHLILESTDSNAEDMLKTAIMYINNERE